MLDINRSRIYYNAKLESAENLELKDKIYQIWDDHNNKGSRSITEDLIEYEKIVINRKKVQRLMRSLGIKGIIPKQNLSKAGDIQYKQPYYLAGMNIYKANQAWGIDITYCILPSGKMYVICLLDLFSRMIVGYVITNTLDTIACLECLDQAIAGYGKPHFLNSDQGSQFTSHAWINLLQDYQIVISMDGKGRWVDNVYVERFWRTLKYECIFLLGIETVADLHKQVAIYIEYYNKRRLHSTLSYKTPTSVYQASITKDEELILYCVWPPLEERVLHSKKAVMVTVDNKNSQGSYLVQQYGSLTVDSIAHGISY